MSPTPTPPVEDLFHWLVGELPADDMAEIDLLVASGDTSVTRTLSWLEFLVRDARRAANDKPPADLHDQLVGLFAQRSSPSEAANTEQVCEGELVFDGRRDRHLMGTRGAATSGSYQLAYTSPFGDVVLEVWPDDRDGVEIHGQLLTEYDLTDPLLVTASGHAGQSASASGDGLGRFRLHRLTELPTMILMQNRELSVSVAIWPAEGG